jgi:putative membrane protein
MIDPSSDRAPDAAGERRLHPLSWLFSVMTHARGLVLPGLVLLLTARFTNADVLLLPAAIGVLVHALVQQFSLRYALGTHEIVVRRNLILHRSERHIPYARVHNLKTSETPIHRWLRVVEVGIETAGGAEPEATLRVLSREALAELRAQVAAGSETHAAPADAAVQSGETAAGTRLVLALSIRDLVICGLLSSRGFVIAGAIAGLAWEAVSTAQGGQLWDPRAWMAPWRLLRSRGQDLVGLAAQESPLWLLLWLVAAFVVLKLFSIAWSVVSLHGFRVEGSRDSLTVRHGIFPRTSTVIPYTRIQRVVIRQKPLHRAFGFVEAQLDTVGRTPDNKSTQPVWLAPLLPRRQLSGLLADAGVFFDFDAAPWQRLHPRAAHRMRVHAAVFLLFASLLLLSILGRWTFVVATVAAPLVLAAATGQAHRFAYALSPPHVVLRRGWLWKTTHLTWIDRIQTLDVTASPFDRRHDMASLLIDTAAGGPLDANLQVPYLGADTARRLQQELSAQTAVTRFHW